MNLVIEYTTGEYDEARDVVNCLVYESKESFLEELKKRVEHLKAKIYWPNQTDVWNCNGSIIHLNHFLSRSYNYSINENVYDIISPEVYELNEWWNHVIARNKREMEDHLKYAKEILNS